jgi:hypothetical protein
MSQSSSDPNWRENRAVRVACQAVEDCPKIPRSGTVCEMHRQRFTRHGRYDAEGGRATYRLPRGEVARLRRMVGLPPEGLPRRECRRLMRDDAAWE